MKLRIKRATVYRGPFSYANLSVDVDDQFVSAMSRPPFAQKTLYQARYATQKLRLSYNMKAQNMHCFWVDQVVDLPALALKNML